MCGINFLLNFPGRGEAAIKKMLEATRHRGPDHSSWLEAASGIFMAGNRLKTQDLGEAGNQPVRLKDKKALLVWNGAVYNHQELRNALLDRGVVFYSRSDAEVLMQWLRMFGQEGVKDLQGMFAFVFMDMEKGHIIIGRDPYGKKPLYFFQKDDQWLISSEARAIAHSGLVERQFDASQYPAYFYSRHAFPEGSFFKEIHQWMPGQVITLDFDGNRVSEFFPKQEPKPGNLLTVGEFELLARDAVLKHMEADVPVGILLSGGADSSLLLHLWNKERGIPLHTFTAVFEKKYRKKYADADFASGLAKKYRSAHHEVLITPDIVLQHWETYIDSLDQPIGDSAGFLTWMLASEAKKYVKILISGAGADELFGGYDRHKALLMYLKHSGIFDFLRQRKILFPLLPRRIGKLLKAVCDSPQETYLNFASLEPIPAHFKGKFLSYFPREGSPYKAALAFDRQYYLVNDVLKIHDNATMAHGVEGRAPFMDRSMVELSNNLSESQLRKLGSKQWIREILTREGYGKIANRRKLGFGLPLKEWLGTNPEFSTRIFSLVKHFEATAGEAFPEDMRKLARHPEKYVRAGFLQIWNLFVLASWKEKQGL